VSRESRAARREAEDLATAVVYTTRSDAEIARAKLQGEGIDALVFADDEGGLNSGFFNHYGVRVVVRAAELDPARAALGVAPLKLPDEAFEAMVRHARTSAPEEACGLFAIDEEGVVRMVYCLSNADRSATSYTIDPDEHFHAWNHARRNGWDIGGVFHSHPASAPVPSPADLDGLDPDWVSVILGATGVRAYRVRDGIATEVLVESG
jgi:[CysO sulfur-carrier protein]-S-L-cysteine hydrolase